MKSKSILLITCVIFLIFNLQSLGLQHEEEIRNSKSFPQESITCSCSRNYDANDCRIISHFTIRNKAMKCYKKYLYPENRESNPICLNSVVTDTIYKRPVHILNLVNCPAPISFGIFMNYLGISKTDALKIKLPNYAKYFLDAHSLTDLQDVTRLDLSSNHLSDIIKDLNRKLPNLTELYLVGNNVKLYKGVFARAEKLQTLELGKNSLTTLEPGVFQNLKSLNNLNLWSNNLTELKREVFSDIPNLKSLDIGDNDIQELKADVFADLKNLTIINLNHNRLVYLPEGLFLTNREMEIVMMYGMKTLTNISSKCFGNMKNLREVRLSKCNISQIPKDLFWGSNNIRSIRLEENSITKLPAELFKDGTELKYIDLSRNKISIIPNDVFNNTISLESLNLSFNRLTIIQT